MPRELAGSIRDGKTYQRANNVGVKSGKIVAKCYVFFRN